MSYWFTLWAIGIYHSSRSKVWAYTFSSIVSTKTTTKTCKKQNTTNLQTKMMAEMPERKLHNVVTEWKDGRHFMTTSCVHIFVWMLAWFDMANLKDLMVNEGFVKMILKIQDTTLNKATKNLWSLHVRPGLLCQGEGTSTLAHGFGYCGCYMRFEKI